MGAGFGTGEAGGGRSGEAGGSGREAGATGFAGFAALGVVLELLIVEKQLLSRSEDKFTVAVGTDQQSVDKLNIHITSP
jgi:hypothetical protein